MKEVRMWLLDRIRRYLLGLRMRRLSRRVEQIRRDVAAVRLEVTSDSTPISDQDKRASAVLLAMSRDYIGQAAAIIRKSTACDEV